MRKRIALAVGLASLLIPAAASAQNIRLVNQANVPAGEIAALETALTGYAQTLAGVWGSPAVTFDDNDQAAWPVLLSATPVTMGNSETGWHAFGASGIAGTDPGTPSPFAEIYWQDPATVDGGLPFDEMAVSHEFAEMLTDPDGTGREIADPVEGLSDVGRAADGVTLSDFVEPSYFTGSPGPQDWTGVLPANPAPVLTAPRRSHQRTLSRHHKRHHAHAERVRHPHVRGAAWIVWASR